MALTYSQWIWGFEVLDSTALSGRNDTIVFNRPSPGPGTKTATLVAGIYTVDEFAAQVAYQLNQQDNNGYRCSFDYTNLKFTIDDNGGGNFQLLFSNVNSPASLLGFSASDTSLANTLTSPSAITTAWTAAEPLTMTSPVLAQAIGTPAQLTQRSVKTLQHVSDGATVESVYISTMRSVQIAFRALLSSEQAKMENFLNWAVTGKRFTWQPDKTSSNLLKLVLANPAQINNTFEWLTRSEATYGTLTFYEQLS